LNYIQEKIHVILSKKETISKLIDKYTKQPLGYKDSNVPVLN